VANEDAGPEATPAAEEKRRPRAAGARKPGAVARAIERCRAWTERISLPPADWRTFGWGLLVLILLAFIIRNWAPVRINLFGWYVDAPRAIVFAIIFLLGMLTAWLLEVRGRKAAESEAEAETAAAADAGETAEEAEAVEAEAMEAEGVEFEEVELAGGDDDLAAEPTFGDEDTSVPRARS